MARLKETALATNGPEREIGAPTSMGFSLDAHYAVRSPLIINAKDNKITEKKFNNLHLFIAISFLKGFSFRRLNL